MTGMTRWNYMAGIHWHYHDCSEQVNGEWKLPMCSADVLGEGVCDEPKEQLQSGELRKKYI